MSEVPFLGTFLEVLKHCERETKHSSLGIRQPLPGPLRKTRMQNLSMYPKPSTLLNPTKSTPWTGSRRAASTQEVSTSEVGF